MPVLVHAEWFLDAASMNKGTLMKVGVIAADELRDRQKFISKPLLGGGHEVRVVRTRPFGRFLSRLLHLLFNDRPDVIVFMGVGVKELLSFGVVKLCGVPSVVRLGGDRLRDLDSVAASLWCDGCYLAWLKCKLDKYIAQLFLKKVEWAIVVNEALATRVSKQLKSAHRTFIIPQFCEGSSIKRDYSIGAPIELLTVVNLRFSEKAEGVIGLIEHLDIFVRNNEVAIHFRVAGDGFHLKDVKEYLKSKVKSDLLTVELAGFVTELDGYYRRAGVLLYRSYHDATPNVILESKRYGLPLLANDCEEFRSIVGHGVTGLLYRDEFDFFALLGRLIWEKELREKIGRGALREHESKFSKKAAQEKIETAFLEIIKAVGR